MKGFMRFTLHIRETSLILTNLSFNVDFFQKNTIINAIVQLEITQVKISQVSSNIRFSE